ncbi:MULTISPECIES: ABC transporter ATP-binding protein [Winogradskyella]|uniref:ABC transporter ATP-binding protein n=1 Tax=Winogradskyella TaxID=286104 RepID=UPI0015CCD5A7|nr:MULTISPECIES: ABC transporter ATP-binding protein [Winogradskyella]QXP80498.1 ABC transporter ATP-binding protein [Winogradskyella sp. HaHa_3_26]
MLKVKNITFGYSKTKVLNAIDFNVKAGENLAIIGESGSGKSTLIKLIYGEYDLDKGQIFWKDEEILGPKYNLVVGYEFMKSVSQEFDLMPVTTVAENIGKFLSNFYPEEKQRRTKELIEVVELEAFANTKVRMLSGGQKQRVAIARALAKQPEILLLDEPFSHIDNFQKQGLRRNVFNYLKANSIACIVATHDRNDVLGFADEIIVLDESKIIVKDTPQNLFKNPQLPLIASFFGEFNVIEPYGIVYEHQIKIVEKSDLKAIVKRAYFKGNSWLIEAIYKSESLFIEHGVELEKGLEIQFSISS